MERSGFEQFNGVNFGNIGKIGISRTNGRLSDYLNNYSDESSEEESDNEVSYQPTKNFISEFFNKTDFSTTRCSYLPQISEQFSDFLASNSKTFQQKSEQTVQTRCVFGVYSDRFPYQQQKATSSISRHRSHPKVIMWTNAADMNNVDYKSYICEYIRSQFSQITRMKFAINTGISNVFLPDKVKACRRDVIDKRILFHYVGFKYPRIDENSIQLPDVTRREPGRVPICSIFENLECPSVFLWDCNNAACVLKTLENTSKRKSRASASTHAIRSVDWSDWICFCATDCGEELPKKCHLPIDFLTSCVITPAETALCCHILQHFRVSHVTKEFPLDGSIEKIIGNKKNELTHTILTIIDSIAAMCFSEEMYDNLIRKDPVIKRLTEGFLLSQFLLKPYMIHPQSRPAIPDLSSHRMWKHLSAELDQYIYASMMGSAMFQADSIFKKAIISISNDNFSEYQTALFSILLNSVGTDCMVDAFSILAKHASLGEKQQKMLAKNTKFSALLTTIVQKKPKEESFHSLCYLALVLLFVEPNFVYDNLQSLDYTGLVNCILKKSLPADTRTLVIALVTSLAVACNPQMQLISEKDQIVEDLLDIVDAEPEPTIWIFLLAKKFMDAINAKPKHIISGGYHVRVASFFLHRSYEVRASLMPLIQCYVGFEKTVDVQLFLLTMFAVFDCSSLVRFSYLCFLGKFMSKYIQELATVTPIKFSESLQEICRQWTYNEEMGAKETVKLEEIITNIDKLTYIVDNIAEKPNTLDRCLAIARFSLNLLLRDPCPSVAEEAEEISRSLGNSDRESDINAYSSVSSSVGSPIFDSDLQYMDSYSRRCSDVEGSFCPSDLLYRVSLKQLVDSKCYKHTKHQTNVYHRGLAPCIVESLIETKVNCNTLLDMHNSAPARLAYDVSTRDICVAMTSGDLMFRNKNVRIPAMASLSIADWKCAYAIAGDTNGSVSIWNPGDGNFVNTFKCDVVQSCQPVVTLPLSEKPTILTSRGIGAVIRMWDVESMRFAGEWKMDIDSSINPGPVSSICLSPNDSNVVVLGYSRDRIEMFDLRTPATIGSLSVDGSIFRVCPNVANECSFFAATREGVIYRIFDSEHVKKIKMDSEISGFDVNERIPLISIAQCGQPAIIASLEGKPLHVLPSINAVSVASHQLLPLVSFGTTDGSVVECEITN